MARDKRSEKEKKGRSGGRSLYRCAVILLIVLAFWLFSGITGVKDTGERPVQSVRGQGADVTGAGEEAGTHPAGEMEVHFIDVGQGDSTLIIQGGHAMLIDAGGNDKGTAVQYYLKKQGIKRLDYLIGTHPDEDHIGGMDVVLYKFETDRVFMPQVSKDTKTYRDVLDTARGKDQTITAPEQGDVYQLGEAFFTVLSDEQKEYADINDASICIRLSFGNNTFLFCGDAGEEAEAALLQSGLPLEADVYKVSHHGSASSSTAEFLEAVSPSYAVVSCGRGNSYGHPDPDTLQRLLHVGADIYRTDRQGTIRAVSDGDTIAWSVEGEETQGEQLQEQDMQEAYGHYILNTHTKKYHLPQCPKAADIKAENRQESELGKAELEEQGYSPCQRCNP